MADDESKVPLEPYPQKDDRSAGYHIARTAIEAAASVTLIPGAGYAVGQLVEAYVSAPLQKRRDEWFTKLGEGLAELLNRLDGFDPSTLVTCHG